MAAPLTLPTAPDYPLILEGDCIERMRDLPANSVAAIVTDPPYGLEFMGKEWDGYGSNEAFGAWCELWLAEALRVLKPGGHIAAFGGTRTWHRLVCAAEDVGFEIRDNLAWLYASGFPKSHNVSKAIDKAAGVEREVTGRAESWNRPDSVAGDTARMNTSPGSYDITAPATEAAQTVGRLGHSNQARLRAGDAGAEAARRHGRGKRPGSWYGRYEH